MDILDLNERALDETARIVAGVRSEQLGTSTPCSDWDVRGLLTHMIVGNYRWATVANSGTMQRGGEPEDPVGDDPAAAYRQSADALIEAWRQPGVLDRMCELPIGTMPGRAAANVRLVETVAHGWDLAKATGQTAHYDDDVVEAAMATAQRGLPAERPPGFPFAPAVEVGDDVPAADRLAAFLGRQP